MIGKSVCQNKNLTRNAQHTVVTAHSHVVVQLSIDLKWQIFFYMFISVCADFGAVPFAQRWDIVSLSLVLFAGKNKKNYAERRGSRQSGTGSSHHNLYPFSMTSVGSCVAKLRRRKRGGRKINNAHNWLRMAFNLGLCAQMPSNLFVPELRIRSLSPRASENESIRCDLYVFSISISSSNTPNEFP